MKKKTVIKNFIPIAAICLVIGFFIALLGFLNYKNNVLNIQTSQGKQMSVFLDKFIESFQVDLETKDAFALIDGLKDTSSILKTNDAEYFLYDKKEGMMYGDNPESKDLADEAMIESGFDEIILDNVHYIPVDSNDQWYMITAYDITALSNDLNTIIPNYAKWFGISFGLLCLIFLIIGFCSKKKRVGKRTACVLVSIWMMILSVYLAVYSGMYFFDQYGKNMECILTDIEEDVKDVNESTTIASFK